MTGWMLVVLALVGVIAGVLNFSAAGGSLLPFVVMTVVGIPALTANATTLAATPAAFLRIAGSMRQIPSVMRWPLVCAVVATAVGVWIVSEVLPSSVFRDAVPVLLVVSVVFLLTFRVLRDRLDRRTRSGTAQTGPHAVRTTTLVVGVTITSAYAGAYGGGVGVLVLTVLTMATNWDWHVLNNAKNLVCLTTSVVGCVAFATTGLVLWPVCVVLVPAMIIGSYVGQWVTDRVPASLQRATVALVTLASAGYLWIT
jgi:uncharacterized membrane protein YfcA